MARPNLDGQEAAFVADCLARGQLSAGRYVAEFEETFARAHGCRHGVATVNGTAALHLVLAALGLGPGDEVLVPAMTFVATANAVAYCGAKPIIVDVDPGYWCLDPRLLEGRVTSRTAGIIPVHLFGHPCDMDAINDTAYRHGLWVVEDAAEAHGAAYRGKPVGSLGDAAVFSFYGNKIITCGEGGMVTTNNEGLAERMRVLRNQGRQPGDPPYFHRFLGYNYRLGELQGAVGLAQTERLAEHVARHRELHGWYAQELQGLVGLQEQQEWADPSWWLTAVTLDRPWEPVAQQLAAQGIETRPFFVPLDGLPMYQGSRSPVSQDLRDRGLCLPSYEGLGQSDVQYVCAALREALHA